MKILTVNWTYNDGSTAKIIKDIEKKLSDCQFIECYESGPKPTDTSMFLIANRGEQLFYYFFARMTGLKYNTGYNTTNRLLRFIRKSAPDVVHLHCPNAYTVNIPRLLNFLKNNNIPTVVTNHAEFFFTGNCPHAFECEKYKTGCGKCEYVFDSNRRFLFDRTAFEWKKMRNAFSGFERIVMVCVSGWAHERLCSSPISANLPSIIITNGVDTDVFRPREDCLSVLNFERTGKILLNVTSNFNDDISDAKGGYYFIELAKMMPEHSFIVCGTTHVADMQKLPANLHIIGCVESQDELAKYYSLADLTITTGKRETFGMACAESMCCGTPVVGFKAGGPESVSLPRYSDFVEFGNIEALRNSICNWIDRKSELHEELAVNARNAYSSITMAEKYRKVYNSFFNGKLTDITF